MWNVQRHKTAIIVLHYIYHSQEIQGMTKTTSYLSLCFFLSVSLFSYSLSLLLLRNARDRVDVKFMSTFLTIFNNNFKMIECPGMYSLNDVIITPHLLHSCECMHTDDTLDRRNEKAIIKVILRRQ